MTTGLRIVKVEPVVQITMELPDSTLIRATCKNGKPIYWVEVGAHDRKIHLSKDEQTAMFDTIRRQNEEHLAQRKEKDQDSE